MLSYLQIKNFAIVTDLQLELNKGMTVITGETGAGKSIMLGALSLCLGARADSQSIRHGEDRCELSACFDVANIPAARQWLSEHELSTDNECVLRRVINRDGRSRAYINGQPSPVQQVRELGSLLINITSQHEHTSLLKREHQARLLDAYAKNQKLLQQIQTIYQQWRQYNDELQALITKTTDQSRLDLLRYQVQELNELALAPAELKQLETEHQQLANADGLLHACDQVMVLIDSQQDQSLTTQLPQAMEQLTPLLDLSPHLKACHELLSQAVIQLDEARGELQQYLPQIERNPQRLHEIDERLQRIYKIAGKHHVKPTALHELQERLEQELKSFTHREEQVEHLQTQLKQLHDDYLKTANKLTKQRKKQGAELSKLVTNHVRQLGMPDGRFDIQLSQREEQEPHPQGLEKIEFMVSANAGQPLQALSKVASGGELSRISLAIHVISAQHEATATQIFDEVDVGIGGGTAEIVGKLLAQLGKAAQVICVTHQPQVASQADQHLKISKQTQGKQTQTQLTVLEREQKIQEIARMLGGVKITKQTLAHAEEMLEA